MASVIRLGYFAVSLIIVVAGSFATSPALGEDCQTVAAKQRQQCLQPCGVNQQCNNSCNGLYWSTFQSCLQAAARMNNPINGDSRTSTNMNKAQGPGAGGGTGSSCPYADQPTPFSACMTGGAYTGDQCRALCGSH
jgi:hypothetical protein